MSAHRLVKDMSKVRFDVGAAECLVIGDKNNGGAVLGAGITVPTDATAGWLPSAVFIHIDGAAGSALYVNEGSVTSCDFDVVTVA